MNSKNILKFGLLIGIKESYLFCRNLLGLKSHPFKTLREIIEDKDYSQAALIFGLPFNLALFGSLFIFSLRILVGRQGSLGWLAQFLLVLLMLLALFMFSYLFYWFFQVWQFERKRKNASI